MVEKNIFNAQSELCQHRIPPINELLLAAALSPIFGKEILSEAMFHNISTKSL
jgi:hypothetical protein